MKRLFQHILHHRTEQGLYKFGNLFGLNQRKAAHIAVLFPANQSQFVPWSNVCLFPYILGKNHLAPIINTYHRFNFATTDGYIIRCSTQTIIILINHIKPPYARIMQILHILIILNFLILYSAKPNLSILGNVSINIRQSIIKHGHDDPLRLLDKSRCVYLQ